MHVSHGPFRLFIACLQAMNRDGSRAGVACFATDWHAAYRASVLQFITEVGLSGVETDGQYEDYPCADSGGDHHHNGLEGSWDAQMAATAVFNEQMKGLGIYQTGADAYLFSGANLWNHAGKFQCVLHLVLCFYIDLSLDRLAWSPRIAPPLFDLAQTLTLATACRHSGSDSLSAATTFTIRRRRGCHQVGATAYRTPPMLRSSARLTRPTAASRAWTLHSRAFMPKGSL
jgi:hypothetical protein